MLIHNYAYVYIRRVDCTCVWVDCTMYMCRDLLYIYIRKGGFHISNRIAYVKGGYPK